MSYLGAGVLPFLSSLSLAVHACFFFFVRVDHPCKQLGGQIDQRDPFQCMRQVSTGS